MATLVIFFIGIKLQNVLNKKITYTRQKISTDFEFSFFSVKKVSLNLVQKFLHRLSAKINLFIQQNIKTIKAFLPI